LVSDQKKLLRNAIVDEQQLEKVRSKTGSYRYIPLIDTMLRRLQRFIWDLDAWDPDADESQRDWERLQQEGWDLWEEADKVENDTYSWHSRVGWRWFSFFSAMLLSLAVMHIFTLIS
jgi:hypothetical protein